VKPPIGFVLATHANPAQILFLCEQLNSRFDHPPISIHHDFGQTPLNTAEFPANVSFVQDWLKTGWGRSSFALGEKRAIRDLYKTADPDWFVNLSGADFPIRPARSILEELYSGPFDAYLDHRRIALSRVPFPPEGLGAASFSHPAWITLAFERYMAIGFGFYKLATRLGWKKKAIYLRSSFLIRHFTPFDGTLQCYAGDHWFVANRKSAHALLDDSETNRKLTEHFIRRPNSDEAIFHSMLGNTPGLRLSPKSKRYSDWTGCWSHPRTLTEADFPALLASGDYFARKFDFNPELLHKLNQAVDQSPA
jgi:hypothetical protein